MIDFGWITQEQVKNTIKVNNALTREIKNFLLENGYEQFQSEEVSSKNCLYHKGKNQYIIVYTRKENGQNGDNIWSPYEYVKKMAKDKPHVLLLLGILEDDSLTGRLYALHNKEIVEKLENQKLNRGRHYSLSENYISKNGSDKLFFNQNELIELLRDIIDNTAETVEMGV